MLNLFSNRNEVKLKTTINCSGCVSKAKPFLDDLKAESWEVDTNSADKTLTVKGKHLDKNAIINAVKKAGFEVK
jgi:hypothetical protein